MPCQRGLTRHVSLPRHVFALFPLHACRTLESFGKHEKPTPSQTYLLFLDFESLSSAAGSVLYSLLLP